MEELTLELREYLFLMRMKDEGLELTDVGEENEILCVWDVNSDLH